MSNVQYVKGRGYGIKTGSYSFNHEILIFNNKNQYQLINQQRTRKYSPYVRFLTADDAYKFIQNNKLKGCVVSKATAVKVFTLIDSSYPAYKVIDPADLPAGADLAILDDNDKIITNTKAIDARVSSSFPKYARNSISGFYRFVKQCIRDRWYENFENINNGFVVLIAIDDDHNKSGSYNFCLKSISNTASGKSWINYDENKYGINKPTKLSDDNKLIINNHFLDNYNMEDIADTDISSILDDFILKISFEQKLNSEYTIENTYRTYSNDNDERNAIIYPNLNKISYSNTSELIICTLADVWKELNYPTDIDTINTYSDDTILNMIDEVIKYVIRVKAKKILSELDLQIAAKLKEKEYQSSFMKDKLDEYLTDMTTEVILEDLSVKELFDKAYNDISDS